MKIRFLKIVFLFCMVIPLVLIGSRFLEYHEEDKKMEQVETLLDSSIINVPAPTITKVAAGTAGLDVKEQEILAFIKAEDYLNMEEIQALNIDVVGVVRIDGTRIDYPVMYTEEMEYYINRDFNGKDSVYGSIFLDSASHSGSSNTIMYGHHMRNGAMFGELDKYIDPEYAKSHSVIKYISGDRVELYQVAAALSVSATEEALLNNLLLDHEGQAEALTELIMREQGSLYSELTDADEYISLITCEYTRSDGRFLLIGKKIGEVLY